MPKFNPPECFNFTKPYDWPDWKQWFLRFRTATKLDKDDGSVQVSSLIYVMGREAEYIFSSFMFDADSDKDDFDKVLGKFDSHFVSKIKAIHEHNESPIFDDCEQEHGQTVGAFVRQLQNLNNKLGSVKSGNTWIMMKVSVEDGLKMDKAIAAVREGVKEGGGNLLDLFRAQAENRFLAVMDGGWKEALKALNNPGLGAKVNSIPVRRFEHWAQDTFGVTIPEDIETEVPIVSTGFTIYNLEFQFEVGDMELPDFLIGLSMQRKAAGTESWHGYKVVTENKLIWFTAWPNNDFVDNVYHMLRTTKQYKGNVTTTLVDEA